MTLERPTDCDVLIVGGGPAGMAAALAAAPTGAHIVMIDDNLALGGQIWRAGPDVALPADVKRHRQALLGYGNVTVLISTRLVAVTGHKQVLLEDVAQGWQLQYDKAILCTGARELLLPFPGWTLPGVTGAGGLQALIKGGLPVRGQRIVVAGTGPLLLAVAASAEKAGAQVLRVAEQAPFAQVAAFAAGLWRWPGKATQAMGLVHRQYRTSSHVLQASGDGHLTSVRLRQGGQVMDLACDRLACGFGLIPNTDIGQALGCALNAQHAIAVDDGQACSEPDHFAAGECTGFGGSERAWVQGQMAGLAAAGRQAEAQALRPRRQHWDTFAASLQQHFRLQGAIDKLATPDTIVCRCEDVRYSQIAACESWVEAKLSTRCGMGACQGRVCGAATRQLLGWVSPVPRLPLAPTRISSLLQKTAKIARSD